MPDAKTHLSSFVNLRIQHPWSACHILRNHTIQNQIYLYCPHCCLQLASPDGTMDGVSFNNVNRPSSHKRPQTMETFPAPISSLPNQICYCAMQMRYGNELWAQNCGMCHAPYPNLQTSYAPKLYLQMYYALDP